MRAGATALRSPASARVRPFALASKRRAAVNARSTTGLIRAFSRELAVPPHQYLLRLNDYGKLNCILTDGTEMLVLLLHNAGEIGVVTFRAGNVDAGLHGQRPQVAECVDRQAADRAADALTKRFLLDCRLQIADCRLAV